MKVGDIIRPKFGHLVPQVNMTLTAKTLRVNQDMFMWQLERNQEFKVANVGQINGPNGDILELITINDQPWKWVASDWETVDPNAPPAPAVEKPEPKDDTPSKRWARLVEFCKSEHVYIAREEAVADLQQLIQDAFTEAVNRHGGLTRLEAQAAFDRALKEREKAEGGDGQGEVVLPVFGFVRIRKGGQP